LSLENSEIEKLKKKYLRPPNQMGLARLKTFVLENSPAWLVVALMRRFVTKSVYESKRESVTFFQRANVAYGAHRQRRSARLLRVAFGLLGDEFSRDYSRLIIGATNQTQLDASRRSALSGEILDATKALPIDGTDATGWYQLSRGLFSVGYFRAAWVARENSIELSIREGEAVGAGATAVGRAIQAHLERRNFANVEALLAKSAGQIKDSSLRDIRDYLDMMQNKYVMPPLDPNSPSFEAEKLFSELITGKSVALVGPGSPSGHYGKEIDSADTVVRVKFIDDALLPADNAHGRRTDVAYVGGGNAILAVKAQQDADANSVVIKTLRLVISTRTSIDQLGNTAVYVFEPCEVLYRTTSVSGMRTMIQILRYLPARVKNFGFDFYTTLKPYSDEYTNFYENTSWRLGHANDFIQQGEYTRSMRAKDSSEHDPVSNFCFAQNSYKAGLFEIEPFGASILALTPYQYVERLEEMLGDW
jgi:hypothetical protein